MGKLHIDTPSLPWQTICIGGDSTGFAEGLQRFSRGLWPVRDPMSQVATPA